ncbi:ABC transporter permease [Mycoplasma bradburyae]|uniref:ABC transporter permease n=1 Tax=Mycoplasma bradburyae TaxID=2963128 RepID=A0AAW6HQI6_9MOLU|nr:ABC transporter permease [Mycoplasma bradburyae]MDC4183561.1 ABC transporter permease [Mycoplasma bradburyae]UTS71041.1 ABC transporter permease [Mycoplasma bradburyae]
MTQNNFLRLLKINKFTVLFALFLILCIISVVIINVNINVNGWEVFKTNFASLFNQSEINKSALLKKSFEYLWTTIKYTTAGTLIGFSLGCFVGYLSALKITNNITAWVIKLVIIFFRSFPVVIFINLFNTSFNSNLSAIIIIAWFSMLWGAKYIADYIENSNIAQFQKFVDRSQNKISSFFNNIYIDIKSKILVLFAYSLESNFRWTTILSAVGLIGFGQLINDPISIDNNFSSTLIPLIVLMTFLLMNEGILYLFENYFIARKSYSKEKNLNKLLMIKKIIIYLFFLIIIGFSLYSLFSIRLKVNNLSIFTDFFERLFNFNTSFFATKTFSENPFLIIIELTLQSILILCIVFVFSLLFATLCSNLVNKYVSIFFKGFFLVIRTIPIIIIFRLFNPLFNSGVSTIVVVGSLYISTSITKKVYVLINSLNWSLVTSMKTKLYTNYEIIRLYILPSIRKDLVTVYLLEFESILRLLITLGAYGTSVIGQLIDIYIYRSNIENLGTYVLSIMFYFQIIDLLSIAIRYKKNIFFYTK